jgi:serine/threonine protein phosphatase 1
MTRTYVIGDIHGQYDQLMRVIKLVRDDGGLDFKNGDRLVQLGDRVDRGPDSFRVNNFFYKLQKRYPSLVICLKGNHEAMMIDAALNRDTWGFLNNGGQATMDSYKVRRHNVQVFGYKLKDSGHLTWIDEQPLYWEDERYFFSHAPIPEVGKGARLGYEFRDSPEVLYWSYGGDVLEDWVDPEPSPGNISVHGHIHGLYRDNLTGQYVSPGIRQVGNAFVIDTGAGCHKTAGYLTCLELTTMTQYNSKGEILKGEWQDDSKAD